MRTIFAEYNPQRNSIDVYTSAGYMLRIDCWEAEMNGRVDTSVTECIPHRIPDVRLFRIRLFTKRIIQQLSVNTDIYFRPR
jgi:hypothetical protein